MSNNNRNSLVTGGVQGIGKGIVDALLARGDNVIVFDCIASSDQRVQELVSVGVQYFSVNIADVSAIEAAFALLTEPLHVLVNNAGITRDNLAVRLQEKDWDSVLEVNLKGAFFCAQQVLKKMMRQQPFAESPTRGYIVNVASVVAHHGNPGQVNYVASKAGLVGVTKTLAQEYSGRSILVNAVAPGFIQTAMTEKLSDKVKEQALGHIGLKRFGTPEDVASLVAFLTSGSADYITGQVIDVTGGML